MNTYLRAIGFSKIEDTEELNEFFSKNLEEKYLVANVTGGDRIIGQYNIGVTQNAGIAFIGEHPEREHVLCDYYFPYAMSHTPFAIDECLVRRYRDRDAYLGIVDDAPLGFSLVFYLTNPVLYNSFVKSGKEYYVRNIYLAGLSIGGVIILPLEDEKSDTSSAEVLSDNYDATNEYDNPDDVSLDEKKNNYINFNSDDIKQDMINHPLNDKEFAKRKMEQLDLLLDNLLVRSQKEDLFSIVHTTISPADSLECDEYDIIGDIISCTQKVNVWTDEVIWDLKVKALDIIINVFINAEDLVGEPMVGRRFKGQIWLQGEIEFLEKTKKQDQKPEIE